MTERQPPAEPVTDAMVPPPGGRKPLSDAALRALAEAAERRAEQDRKLASLQEASERNGRGGLDPVRYDDWEIKGLASDF